MLDKCSDFVIVKYFLVLLVLKYLIIQVTIPYYSFVSCLTSLRIFLAPATNFFWRMSIHGEPDWKQFVLNSCMNIHFYKNNFILFTLIWFNLSIFLKKDFFGPIVLFGNPETHIKHFIRAHVSCKLCSESSDLKWKVLIQISI